ncbi:MAG: DUF86 domain-containing protein [Candidatus Pacebacteria bacterium]|jgi:uncharacterized protein YutE (UPF0331/DUF86 family)|nr:DUF86 domain-containing protein [Candidatus Paceibacterota bacterium]
MKQKYLEEKLKNFKNMLKATFVNKKLSSIEKDLERLEKYSSLNQEEILSNYEKQATIERLIERVINQAIDINQYIIKSLASNKTPENYKETFLILADLGIYTKEFGENISQSVGLRNILAHDYDKIDSDLLYTSIFACLKDYKQYVKALVYFLN